MRFYRWLLAAVILAAALTGNSGAQSEPIRYVALGDSYTIGSGVEPQQAWPVLLTKHLQAQGVKIELVANLARNGWDIPAVLDAQIPKAAGLKPNFVTVLIGANDWVRGTDQETFAQQFKILLDQLQKILPARQQILIVTIPDFSVTPYAKNWGNRLNVKTGIAGFNTIIAQEAQTRGITVVDIFKVSQGMGEDPSLVADGLHPSAKEHAVWEKEIFPSALELLQSQKSAH